MGGSALSELSPFSETTDEQQVPTCYSDHDIARFILHVSTLERKGELIHSLEYHSVLDKAPDKLRNK